MDFWAPRLLPYIVAFVVGGIIQFVSDSPLFSIVAGIVTWLCCAGMCRTPLRTLKNFRAKDMEYRNSNLSAVIEFALTMRPRFNMESFRRLAPSGKCLPSRGITATI